MAGYEDPVVSGRTIGVIANMKRYWLWAFALAWCVAFSAMAQPATGAIAQVDVRAKAAALATYRKSFAIRETLAARDAANVQWQIDVAASCSNRGMHASLSTAEQSGYLWCGLEILQGLKVLDRLPPNQDWTGWFEVSLQELDSD